MPSRQDVINYIIQSAQRRGIDPGVAIRVFQQESGLNPNARNITPREKSYGIAQLNLQGGLGVEARRRGIEPTDPSQWQKHVDFSLDTVKRDGWRQWMGARDTGISRWQGVNTASDTGRTKTPKSIDLTSEPTLQNLTPSDKGRPINPADRAETQILKQMAPTEASNMARPSVKDAIRQSMDELGIKDQIQMAGFVPPGLTKGAARTRALANRGVDSRAPMPIERDIGADVGPYNRNAPGTRGMEGSYADYAKGEKSRMWLDNYKAWREGKGPHPGPSPAGLSEEAINAAVPPSTRRPDDRQDTTLPPGVKNATDPAGAIDPRTGTAIEQYDPNLAAQNDPARQALIAARIRGTARGGGQPPPQLPPSNTVGAAPGNLPKAAAAGAAVAAGVSAGREDEDPAVAAVKQQMQAPNANVDPGVAAYERQLNLPPGTLTNPNTGAQQMATPIIQNALPVINEVMKDPQSKQAVQVLTKRMAQVQAQQADMQNDPTFYQQQAARRQMQPGGGGGGDPIADRAMERAVMMDRPSRTSPQQPQGQTTRGTVGVRSTPQVMRDQSRPIPPEEVMPQPIPPGAEKGDIPQRTPVPPGFPIPPHTVRTQSIPPTMRGAADPRGAEAYPIPPGAQNVTGGVQGMPSSGQMPMDPVMMQLMQFFTQGGGGVE